MQVGDLVKPSARHLFDLIGVIINIRDGERRSLFDGAPIPTVYYTVHWQNGVTNIQYEENDLVVLNASR